MNFKNIKSILPAASLMMALSFSSCIGDLDVKPIDPNITTGFYQDEVFNKIYGTLGLTGQSGPDGDGDIEDIDEGTSSFYRVIWYANQLTTDETIINGWDDPGLPSLLDCTWGASNELITGLYYRLNFNVTLCNWFLQQTADGTDTKTIQQRAEVRFLRALNYYYLMDLYANVPFTEEVKGGNYYPEQINRQDLFQYLEKELIGNGTEAGCVEDLAAPRSNTYGRVDKAAAWLLAARMYLNAEVYTGTARWSEAKKYAEDVINSGYSLSTVSKGGHTPYQMLFMADNDVNGSQSEVILPILQSGAMTQSWGGSLFLIASTHKDDMNYYGCTEQWKGPHCREKIVEKFFPAGDAPEVDEIGMIAAAGDDRAIMFGKDRKLSTGNNKDFTDGYSCAKFTNVRADGLSASDSKFPDMDIPFMRLAEAYLILAEADMRMNGGVSTQTAAAAVNTLRARANNPKQLSSYSLTDIRDEWAREFWFEGRRRMDLIRFNSYAGDTNYTWDWKGGIKEGGSLPAYRELLPIPTNDLNANPNLVQNPGY